MSVNLHTHTIYTCSIAYQASTDAYIYKHSYIYLHTCVHMQAYRYITLTHI